MTHVYPFTDEGSERIRSQVFDKRSATEAPSTSGASTPTGTGLYGVTSGVMDAAAVTIGSGLSLAAGELSATGGSGISSGTSNPGSPSNNDLFYRTDLDLLIYYDGTRWLTVAEYLLSMAPSGSFSANATPGRWAVDGNYGMFLTKWQNTPLVVTTNTGAAYWTIALQRTTSADVATTIASFTTAADAPNVWLKKPQAIDAVMDASAFQLQVVATKAGSPGVMFFCSSLQYRKIIT